MRIAEFLIEKPVESAWISNLTHNRPNKVLTMRLSNGKYFTIPGITRTMFEKWTNAQSKGRFFHQFIKNRYNISRIK